MSQGKQVDVFFVQKDQPEVDSLDKGYCQPCRPLVKMTQAE